MKKIPTLFVRDPENMSRVVNEVNPAARWVFDGPAAATRKYDGTCTMLDIQGRWWARREVKPGKVAPDHYLPIETDEATGKTVGWEPIEQSPFHKAWFEADTAHKPDIPSTYELCGPKVNGNPEGLIGHVVIPHGLYVLSDVPIYYHEIAAWLAAHPFEGIVWYHPDDGRMAKIKCRDFGVRWPLGD